MCRLKFSSGVRISTIKGGEYVKFVYTKKIPKYIPT